MQNYKLFPFNYQKIKRIAILISILFFTIANAQVKTENNDFSYGSKLFEQGFHKLAIQQYQSFIKNYPNSSLAPEAGFNIGLAYYKLKEYQKSGDAFQAMAVSYPESGKALQAWYYVGLCDEELNRSEDAAKAYMNIRLLAPEDPLAAKSLYRAAVNYLQIGNLIDAENAVRGLMDRYQESKEYIPAHILMGKIYLRRSSFDEAQKWFRKVIFASGDEDQETKMEAYRNLAKVLIEQGRFTDALNTYIKIEKSSTSDLLKSDGALGQLETLLLMNRLSEAESKLEEVREFKFSDTQQKFLRQLEIAFYLISKDPGKAYQVAQLLIGDSNAKSLAYYSEVLLELKKYQNLIKLWDDNNKDLDDKDPYKSIFSLNVLRAGFRSQSSELTNIITQIQTQYGKSTYFADALAREVENAHNRNNIDIILQWGGYFVRNFPGHLKADEISWWVAQNTENPNLKTEKLHQVLERYPVGDFDATPFEEESFINHQNDYPYLFERLLDIQVKMVTDSDPAQLLPELAETYLGLGKMDKAEEILKNIDANKLHYENRLRAKYLLGLISFSHYKNDQENLALISESKNYFTFIVAQKDSNIYLEPASEKLVEVSLILMDDGPQKPDKTYQFYMALLKNFPRSPKRNSWLLKMAEAQLSQIKEKNDEYFQNAVNSLTQILSDTDLSKNSVYWQAKYDLAYAMDKVGNSEQALEHYRDIIDHSPDSFWHMKSLIAVYRLLALKNPEEAGLKLYQLLDSYGYSNLVWQELDQIPLSLWPENAGAFLEKRFTPIAVLDPLFRDTDKTNLKIANYLGEFYLYHKNYFSALKNLNYIYIQNPSSQSDIRMLSNLAIATGGLKQYEAAVWFWGKVAEISQGKTRSEAYLQQAEIFYNSGSFDEVSQLIEKLDVKFLDADKRDKFLLMAYSSFLKLGKKALSDKFYAQNKEDFKKNNTLASGALISLGDYYLSENNYDKAMNSYTNAEKKGEKTEYFDDAVFKQILVKVRLNKVQEAFEDFSNFLEKYPESNRKAEVYMTLAQLYYRSEKVDETLAAYKNALAAANDDNVWRMAAGNLIKISYDMGLYNSALTLARDYIKKFPDAIDAVNKKILIGRCYARMGQRDLAIKYLKQLKLQVSAETEPEIQFAIGEIYFNEGEYETAIVELLKIPVMSKKTKLQWEASALYYAGQSYEKLGRIDEAVRMYEEIIKRPGIMADLKKAARDRIKQIKG